MKSILLSLGHNSSAILVEDGRVVCGYEEERLSGTKSDSRFPRKSLDKILETNEIPEGSDILISHWFPDGNLRPGKYLDIDFIKNHICDNPRIISLSPNFTHHDAHAWSAIAFTGEVPDNTMVLVADGFGNFGEVISIYFTEDSKPILSDRSYGYNTSLGLLYQYATSFLDMKEHQDEYKLLGYEAYVEEALTDNQISALMDEAARMSKKMIANIKAVLTKPEYDPMVSVDALPALKDDIRYWLKKTLKAAKIDMDDVYSVKVATSFLVQNVVETAITSIIRMHKPSRLILVGGLFYNVKLNSVAADLVDEWVSIMPLAGDQGAAIGLYHYVNYSSGGFIWPEHLFWGKRTLYRPIESLPGLYYFDNENEAIDFICDKIDEDRIINLVKGDMEFGPRALCNTSTLARPTAENVATINSMNSRATVMPMAPVITKETAHDYFYDVDKIYKSLEYMICTREYRKYTYSGASSKIPMVYRFTGRPQVIDRNKDMFMHEILTCVEDDMLINTSFNYHGEPIVFSVDDVVRTHIKQCDRAAEIGDRAPLTVIIGG